MLSGICKNILENSNTDELYDLSKIDNYYNNIIIYENIFAENYKDNRYILSLASEKVRDLIFKYTVISDLYNQSDNLILEYKNTKKLNIQINHNKYLYNLYNKTNIELPDIIDIDNKLFNSIRPSLLIHIKYLEYILDNDELNSEYKYKYVLETILYFHEFASEILYIKIILDINKNNKHLINIVNSFIENKVSQIFALNYDFIKIMKINNNLASDKYKIYNDNIPQLILYDNICESNINKNNLSNNIDKREKILEIKNIYIFLIILLVFFIFLILISTLYSSSDSYRQIISFYIFISSLILSIYLYISTKTHLESFLIEEQFNDYTEIEHINHETNHNNTHIVVSENVINTKIKTLNIILYIKLNIYKNNFINIIEEFEYDSNIDNLNVDKETKAILYKKKPTYLNSKYTELDKVKSNNEDDILIMNIILLLIVIITFLNLIFSFLT